MKKNKKLPIILAAIFLGLPALCGIAFGVAWKTSPQFREDVLETMLLTNTFPFDNYAARELRDYPSKNAAIALVVYLNMTDPKTELGEKAAQDALSSLWLLSGQDFGVGFEGNRYSYSWAPPSGDKWDKVIPLVDGWAVEAFGPEVLLEIAAAKGEEVEDEEEAEEVESESATGEVQP